MTALPTLLAVVASALALIGVGLAVAAVAALRRRRLSAAVMATLSGLALLLLGFLGWFIVLGTRGYRALTREEVAATVEVHPTGPASFRAVVERPGEPPDTFRIAGDQLYVDARVLKWKPWVNLLGVHTGYRLERIGGRYRSVDEERRRERTVYALSEGGPVDFFGLVEAVPFLSTVVDATYGSASFVAADRGTGAYQIRVSTTGLLIRSIPDSTAAEQGSPG